MTALPYHPRGSEARHGNVHLGAPHLAAEGPDQLEQRGLTELLQALRTAADNEVIAVGEAHQVPAGVEDGRLGV